MTTLPPGPAEPPVLQTLRWLLRPISFLESCRRRFGDVFSVRFLGFPTPQVMISVPGATQGYRHRGARLPALLGDIDALLAAEIAHRRADPREDILSMLVAARFEDGEPMDGGEVRDQLMTLLVAGHETTATGLAWTFDLLLRHPRVLERLIAAVDAGDEAYVRAVVSESLRLRPVVPLAGRRLST